MEWKKKVLRLLWKTRYNSDENLLCYMYENTANKNSSVQKTKQNRQ